VLGCDSFAMATQHSEAMPGCTPTPPTPYGGGGGGGEKIAAKRLRQGIVKGGRKEIITLALS
jgi:hypothetical protein